MANVEKLEEAYNEAREAYVDDPNETTHKKYKNAKQKFADARAEQRRGEEQDPNHSRGNGLAVVTNPN